MVWRGTASVFVVVAQVGVEAVGEPVLGVVREEPQHHLQAAAPGAQHRDPGVGIDLVGAQLDGGLVAGGGGVLEFLLRGGDRAVGGGDRLVLRGGGGVRVGEQRGEGGICQVK